jgi:hypothetical protein
MLGWFAGAGNMGAYWHPGDGRLFWSGYESYARGLRHDADAVRFGAMTLENYGKKNGLTLVVEDKPKRVFSEQTKPSNSNVSKPKEASAIQIAMMNSYGGNSFSSLRPLLWAGPGPKKKNPISDANQEATKPDLSMEIFQGDKHWDEDLKRMEAINNDSRYPWNHEEYPSLRSVGWKVLEGATFAADRIVWVIDPTHNAIIHPWGFYETTIRAYLYNKDKQKND